MLKIVCVYCASSNKCKKSYLDLAASLGELLAGMGLEIIYGGGKVGLMGVLADKALERNGKVTGIIPKFMVENGWGHKGITKLKLVEDMHQRTEIMMSESDVFICLPGGCGTFHELLEVITWKRLGLHTKPVIIVNADGYYDPLIEQFNNSIEENFMSRIHGKMWDTACNIKEIKYFLKNPSPWEENALEFANV